VRSLIILLSVHRDKTLSKDGNDWLTAEQVRIIFYYVLETFLFWNIVQIQTTTLLNDASARAALLALVKTQVRTQNIFLM
jgi:hypothetical protein